MWWFVGIERCDDGIAAELEMVEGSGFVGVWGRGTTECWGILWSLGLRVLEHWILRLWCVLISRILVIDTRDF